MTHEEYTPQHADKHPDNEPFTGTPYPVYVAYFEAGEPVEEISEAEQAELDELLKDVDPEDIEVVAIDDEREVEEK